jgi:uncharacterized protein (TIGR03435 family)
MQPGFCRLLIPSIVIASALAQNAASPAHMAPDAHPSFDVAAIKPHDPDSHRQGFSTHGQHVTIQNQSIASLILFAYSIHPAQIVEAPAWALHDRYDIDGKTETPGEPNLRQQQEMIQKLLAYRFQLRFHRDKRELSVYAIQIFKGGPRLTPAANPDAQPDQDANVHGTELIQIYTSATISDLIPGMQFFLDRPIVDQTSLTGRYDIKLRYNSDELGASDPNAAPSIFTATQQQLGLKLESVKAPVDVFVFDHVERPSAN